MDFEKDAPADKGLPMGRFPENCSPQVLTRAVELTHHGQLGRDALAALSLARHTTATAETLAKALSGHMATGAKHTARPRNGFSPS